MSEKPNPIEWFDAEVTVRRTLRIMVPTDIVRAGESHREVALEMADLGSEAYPEFVQIIEEETQVETLERIAPSSPAGGGDE